MKKLLIPFLVTFVLSCDMVSAQSYFGPRSFDGEHKNEISGYLTAGKNVVTSFFVGENFNYIHHFTDRWSINAGEVVQFNKNLFSINVAGTYRLPTGRNNLFFDAKVVNNAYTRWSTYELLLNASAYWEASYMDIRFGISFIHYYKYQVKDEYRWFTDAGYSEPLEFTIGLGVNIRPRTSPWNLGLFIRNYDDYYYENWNINWGARFYATLPWHELKLFGELNTRPAGSMSQLATFYENSLKLGTKYVF